MIVVYIDLDNEDMNIIAKIKMVNWLLVMNWTNYGEALGEGTDNNINKIVYFGQSLSGHL